MSVLLQSIEPRLPVSDLKRSVDFYRRLLAFDSGDTVMLTANHEFAILRKGKIGLQLIAPSPAHPLHPNTLWIEVSDTQALYDSVKDSFRIEWGPEVYSYGRREFCVGDPDQHQIIFSEVTTDSATCPE